jgi:flagellar hook-length control protein FliK
VPSAAPAAADAPIAVTEAPVLGRPFLSAALTPADTQPAAAAVASTTKTPPEPAQPDPVAALPSAPVAASAAGPAAPDIHAATAAPPDKAHASPAPAVSAAAAPAVVADAGTAGASAPVASTPPAPTAAAAPPPAAPAPPAVQLADAVGSIAIDTRGTGSVTVHLQPSDLGSVAIRVGSTAAGTATVAVTVERSATLATLQADLGHLHQALDRAGVSENRSITLHLATATDPGRGQGGDQGFGQGSSQGFAGGSGAFGQGGSPAGGQHGQPRPQAAPAPSAMPGGPDPMPMAPPRQTQPAGSRAGVNITA